MDHTYVCHMYITVVNCMHSTEFSFRLTKLICTFNALLRVISKASLYFRAFFLIQTNRKWNISSCAIICFISSSSSSSCSILIYQMKISVLFRTFRSFSFVGSFTYLLISPKCRDYIFAKRNSILVKCNSSQT